MKMFWFYKIAALQLLKLHKAENNFLQAEEIINNLKFRSASCFPQQCHATSGDTGWGWPEPARLNTGKAPKLPMAPKALKTMRATVWARCWNFTGIYCTLPPPCPRLPTCDKSQSQGSCSAPGQSQPPSTSKGLEWTSSKSRSAAFRLPRDRKPENLGRPAREAFAPPRERNSSSHCSSLTPSKCPWTFLKAMAQVCAPESMELQHSGAGLRLQKPKQEFKHPWEAEMLLRLLPAPTVGHPSLSVPLQHSNAANPACAAGSHSQIHHSHASCPAENWVSRGKNKNPLT